MKNETRLDIKILLKDNKHLIILLYYIVMYFGYEYLNKTIVPVIYLHSPIDNHIPFVKEMAIPYIAWYPYIVLPLVYFAFRSPKDFTRLCIFMFAGMTISYIIFYLVPNGQNLRPELAGSDIFSNILRHIYTNDNPTNSLPNMHVIDSVAVHASIARSRLLKKRKPVVNTSFVTCILICSSTVFVKQHSILDVFAGLVVSWILYQLVYDFDIVYRFKILYDSGKPTYVKFREFFMDSKSFKKRNPEF